MKKIKDIVGGSNEFKRWRELHAEAERLQSAVGAVLAAHGISPDSCIADILANEELRLTAVSAAACVRIRQILPTLQRTLNSNGFTVRKSRVCVCQSAS